MDDETKGCTATALVAVLVLIALVFVASLANKESAEAMVYQSCWLRQQRDDGCSYAVPRIMEEHIGAVNYCWLTTDMRDYAFTMCLQHQGIDMLDYLNAAPETDD